MRLLGSICPEHELRHWPQMAAVGSPAKQSSCPLPEFVRKAIQASCPLLNLWDPDVGRPEHLVLPALCHRTVLLNDWEGSE